MAGTSPMDLFASIARLLYEVGADVAAIGPDSATLVRDRTGVELPGTLVTINRELARIQEALAEVRPQVVRAELDRNAVSANQTGLKLHLGSGPTMIDSWLNIDVFPATFRLNLKWGLPFADGSADYVFFSHVLEHFFYPLEAFDLLREIHRVLKVGGVVRIIVPDIEKCIRAYYEGDDAFFNDRKEYWPWARKCTTRLEHFLEYAGANQKPEYLWDAHKFGYDFETMALLLERVGFTKVTCSEYMKSEDSNLRVDDKSVFAGFAHGYHHYSLFVEATR